MRIISGTAAGRIIKVPKGYDVRPTPDIVKQALLTASQGGRRRRGSGAFCRVGRARLECLSRGAQRVTSVEKANRHARMIRENLEAIGLDQKRSSSGCRMRLWPFGNLRPPTGSSISRRGSAFRREERGRRSTSFSQKLLMTSGFQPAPARRFPHPGPQQARPVDAPPPWTDARSSSTATACSASWRRTPVI